jgi:DNA-binding beta-propeller fold protein YncE
MRPAPTAIALATAALAALALASSAAGLSVSANISVGTSPRDIAFRADGQHAYVTMGSGVSLIDTATRTVSRLISVPGPTALATGGTRLTVGSDAGSGQYRAYFYDTQINNALGNETLARAPSGVAMEPAGSFSYLATDVTITKVNAASQAIAAQSAQAQMTHRGETPSDVPPR